MPASHPTCRRRHLPTIPQHRRRGEGQPFLGVPTLPAPPPPGWRETGCGAGTCAERLMDGQPGYSREQRGPGAGTGGSSTPSCLAAKGTGQISVTLGSLSRTSRCPGAPWSRLQPRELPLVSSWSHDQDLAQACRDTGAAAAASMPQFPCPRAGPSCTAQVQQHERQTRRAFPTPL